MPVAQASFLPPPVSKAGLGTLFSNAASANLDEGRGGRTRGAKKDYFQVLGYYLAELGLTWRRGSESNRRMQLLQSRALPLGYPAARRPAHNRTGRLRSKNENPGRAYFPQSQGRVGGPGLQGQLRCASQAVCPPRSALSMFNAARNFPGLRNSSVTSCSKIRLLVSPSVPRPADPESQSAQGRQCGSTINSPQPTLERVTSVFARVARDASRRPTL